MYPIKIAIGKEFQMAVIVLGRDIPNSCQSKSMEDTKKMPRNNLQEKKFDAG